MSIPKFKGLDKGAHQVFEFRQLLDELKTLCREVGYTNVAYTDPSLPLFQELSEEDRDDAINKLRAYLSIMTSTKEDVGSVLNNAASVWRAISRFGLVPPSGLIERLTNEHVIEIHDAESRQIFRSFNYFPLTTHTLEELHCVPWFKLWRRNDENHAYFIDVLNKMHTGELKGVYTFKPETQIVQEAGTDALRTNSGVFHIGSTLNNKQGQFSAFLSTFILEKVWDARQDH